MSSLWINRSRMFLFSTAIFIFVALSVGGVETLAPFLSVFSILALLVSFQGSGRFACGMSMLFLSVGTWLVIQRGIGIGQYVMLYGEMVYLLAMFALVPLLTLPIQIGGYGAAIQKMLMSRNVSSGQMYRSITSIAFLLGTFLNVATIPLMTPIVKLFTASVRMANANRFVSVAVLQCYTLPILWTPVSGVVGVIVDATGVRWLSIFPFMLLLSILGLLLNWILFSLPLAWLNPYETKGAEPDSEHSDEPHALQHNMKKLLQIVAAIVLLILTVLLVDSIFALGLVVVVTLVSFPYALCWTLLLGRGRELLQETRAYFQMQLPKMSESFLVFISAGFFLRSLQYSGTDVLLNELVLLWSEWTGSLGLLVGLPFLTVLLAFLGIHPVVTTTLLSASLYPELLGIPVEKMAGALLGGTMLTFMIGPYSGSVGLLSTHIGESTFRISRWNAVFAAAFFLLIVAALVLW